MRRMLNPLVAATMLCAGALPARATELRVPAISDPPTAEHHTGKVIFEQLVVPDLAAAEAFYTGLFGWSFRDVHGIKLPYAIAYSSGHPVAGIVQREIPSDQHPRLAWLSFFSVPDADAAAKTAADHGARILVEPHTVADRGREAIMADPQGAVFAILASTSGDPPDGIKPPGDWIWRALLTTDPVTDAAFYGALFGYKAYPMASKPGQTHLLLASENYARATANTMPANRPNLRPYWLDFVRIDSAAQSVAKAVSLGGRVLVEPRPDRHGGMIAVVADPAGAPVGLFEWSDANTKAVAQ